MAELSPQRPFEALGRAVALRRTQLGLKRRDLADGAELSYPYISEIENGLKEPSTAALGRIAEALEFSLSELLGLSETLEFEDGGRRESPGTSEGFASSLQLLLSRIPDKTPHSSPEDEPAQTWRRVRERPRPRETDTGMPSQMEAMVRAEVRRELDAWATYRLPELIHQELRRLAPELLTDPDE